MFGGGGASGSTSGGIGVCMTNATPSCEFEPAIVTSNFCLIMRATRMSLCPRSPFA